MRRSSSRPTPRRRGAGSRNLWPEVELPPAGTTAASPSCTWIGRRKNGFRYFYTVTAFDVNSFESGPSSLESPRNTKSITPVRPAGNFFSEGILTTSIIGRGKRVDNLSSASLNSIPPLADSAVHSRRLMARLWASLGSWPARSSAAPGQCDADAGLHRTGERVRRHADDLLRDPHIPPRPRSSSLPLTQDQFEVRVSQALLFNGDQGGSIPLEPIRGRLQLCHSGTRRPLSWWATTTATPGAEAALTAAQGFRSSARASITARAGS